MKRASIAEADYDLITTLQNVLGNSESRNILARLQATTAILPKSAEKQPPVVPSETRPVNPFAAYPLYAPLNSLDRDVEALARLIQQKDEDRRNAERRAMEAEDKLHSTAEERDKLRKEHLVATQEANNLREVNKGLQIRETEHQTKLVKTQNSLSQALARVRDTEARCTQAEQESRKNFERNQSLQQLVSQSEAVHAEEISKREKEVAREVRTERDNLRVKFQEADAEKRAAIAAMSTVLSETEDLATKATDMDLEARLITTSMLESLDDAERLVAEPTGVALLLDKLGAARQQLTQVARLRQDLDYFRKRFRVIQNRLSTPASTSLDPRAAEQQLQKAQMDLRTIRASEAMQQLRSVEEKLESLNKELSAVRADRDQLAKALREKEIQISSRPPPRSPDATELFLGQSTFEPLTENSHGEVAYHPPPRPVDTNELKELMEQYSEVISKKDSEIRYLRERLESVTESITRTDQAAHDAALRSLQDKLHFSETTVKNQQKMVEALEDQVMTINQRYEALRIEYESVGPTVTSLQAQLYGEQEMLKRKRAQIEILEQKLQAATDNLRNLKLNFEQKLIDTEERFQQELKTHFRSAHNPLSFNGSSSHEGMFPPPAGGVGTPNESVNRDSLNRSRMLEAEYAAKLSDIRGQWHASRDLMEIRMEQLQLQSLRDKLK